LGPACGGEGVEGNWPEVVPSTGTKQVGGRAGSFGSKIPGGRRGTFFLGAT